MYYVLEVQSLLGKSLPPAHQIGLPPTHCGSPATIMSVVMAYPGRTSKFSGYLKISPTNLVGATGIKVIPGKPEKRCTRTILRKKSKNKF
jgi:hypothetical protein